MDNKIVKVIFKEGWETMYSSDLTKCDYGQVLQIEGIVLPDGNVEVHFSLTEHNGEAPVSIGTVKDNVITVDIPDFILAKENEYNSSYEAYAWVYVTDGESGRTIRKIAFTIDSRPKPTTNVPQDQKDKFLQEVRQVMAETKEVADSVGTDADNGKFNGPQGDNGKSAYEYAVEGGFEGTEQEFIDLMAQAGQVDLTGYVTKEQHEAELLKAFVKVTTDKAPFHNITDSANMKVVDFGLEGITEQETTRGKNKLDTSALTEQTINGVTFTPYYTNGMLDYVLVNGTATANCYYRMALDDKEDYMSKYDLTFSGCPSGGSTTTYSFIHHVSGMSEVGSGKTLSAGNQTDSVFSIKVSSGTTISNLKFYPMVRLATETDATYEPYTNGPSPNPDYKQEVKNAGVYNEETGRYEHKCCVGNKNWFDVEKAKDESNYIWGTKYPFFPVYVGKGNTVTFSCKLPTETDYSVILFDGVDGNVIKYVWHFSNDNVGFRNNVITFTSPNDYVYVRVSVNNLPRWLNDFTDIQIELGDTATTYTPHASQPFTLTSDRPLTKWDNLVKRDGKWYWDYKQLKLVVDGERKWHIYTSNSCRGFRCEGLDFNGSRKSGYCNQLIVETSALKNLNTLWLGVSNNNNIYVANSSYFDDSLEDKGLANWKAHLNEHPLEIYTYKDESELVPLPDEEQTLLNNLETYYGVTNVYNEQGCPISITYCADQELHWNQKLLQIQQAII